jgi:PTS system galactitol-specific IIA component
MSRGSPQEPLPGRMTPEPAEERPGPSLFDPALARLGMEVSDRREAVSVLAEAMRAAGKVRESFLEGVLEREAEFPTGLPTPGAAIAIPHTDVQHCIEPAVAVGTLRDAVEFEEMGSPGSTLDVRIVFLLSITNPEDHVEWLSRLSSAFQTPKLAQKLLESTSTVQACRLLRAGVEGQSTSIDGNPQM